MAGSPSRTTVTAAASASSIDSTASRQIRSTVASTSVIVECMSARAVTVSATDPRRSSAPLSDEEVSIERYSEPEAAARAGRTRQRRVVRDAQPGAAGSMAESPPLNGRREAEEDKVTITPGGGPLQATPHRCEFGSIGRRMYRASVTYPIQNGGALSRRHGLDECPAALTETT